MQRVSKKGGTGVREFQVELSKSLLRLCCQPHCGRAGCKRRATYQGVSTTLQSWVGPKSKSLPRELEVTRGAVYVASSSRLPHHRMPYSGRPKSWAHLRCSIVGGTYHMSWSALLRKGFQGHGWSSLQGSQGALADQLRGRGL